MVVLLPQIVFDQMTVLKKIILVLLFIHNKNKKHLIIKYNLCNNHSNKLNKWKSMISQFKWTLKIYIFYYELTLLNDAIKVQNVNYSNFSRVDTFVTFPPGSLKNLPI